MDHASLALPLSAAVAATTNHTRGIPLLVVGAVLLLVALAVRKIIKLALLVTLAGAAAIVVAAWRGGFFS